MVKKKGKIAKVNKMFKDGLSIADIAKKTGLSQQVVRAYKWRVENPEKYKAMIRRYFARRKQKAENAEIKNAVKNS